MSNYQDIYNQREQRIRENKSKVIEFIRIMQNGGKTEKEDDEMIQFIEENTLDPEVTNLIFWDKRQLTAEEIYQIAMSYKSIIL